MDFFLEEKSRLVGTKLVEEADEELKTLLLRSRLNNEGKAKASQRLNEISGSLIQGEKKLYLFFDSSLVITARRIRKEIEFLVSRKEKVLLRSLPELLVEEKKLLSLGILIRTMMSLAGVGEHTVIAGATITLLGEIPPNDPPQLPKTEEDSIRVTRLFLAPLLQQGEAYLRKATHEITERGVQASAPVRKTKENQSTPHSKVSALDKGIEDLLAYVHSGKGHAKPKTIKRK